MDLQDVLNILQYFLGKDKPDITLHPDTFNSMLKMANLKHYNIKLGLPQEYQVGMPLPRQVVEVTERNMQDLRPFKVMKGDKYKAPLIVDSDGYCDVPSDFYYPSSMSYKYFYSQTSHRLVKVRIVRDSTWDRLLASEIKRPTLKKPIANFQSDYIRFYPTDVKFINFNYWKLPTTPVYGYSTTGGYYSYDSTTSTQLQWDDINIIDIIYIMLADLGVNAEKQSITQAAEKVKATGK